MKKVLIIFVILIIVGALAWMAYKFIFKKPEDGTRCSTTGGSVNNGSYLNGVCIADSTGGTNGPHIDTNPTLGGDVSPVFEPNSVQVNESSIAIGQNINNFFNNIQEQNISSFNITTSAGSNPGYIHFKTNFQNQCPQFVWYKKWLYTFIRVENAAKQVEGSGVGPAQNTCYYKVDRTILPNEIKVAKNNNTAQCANFKLFTSGVEYKFLETRKVTNQFSHWTTIYCIYKKQ